MNPAQESARANGLTPSLRKLCGELHSECGAERFGVTEEAFAAVVAEVAAKYVGGEPEAEVAKFLRGLKLEELALARGCMAGNERAWEEFLSRYRDSLYGAAYGIAKDEATGRELADSLYAELYGLGEVGARRSKLAYYYGRGSLEGWLRTVLAQEFINRYRSGKKTVSLEDKVEEGAQFAAPMDRASTPGDASLEQAASGALAELQAEERFLLAAYFLDGRTLAEIGRMLRVHESTVSRKLEKLIVNVRKRIRQRLIAEGMNSREADERMQDIDVRDLQIDLRANLKQETDNPAFYKRGK